MTKRAFSIAASVVLLCGLVTVLVLTLTGPRLPPPVTLPDGSTMQLMHVGYGTEHVQPDKGWHVFARHLPWKWRNWLDVPTVSPMRSPEPSLGLWFMCSKDNNPYRWRITIVDDQGFEVPVRFSDFFSGDPTEGFRWLGLNFCSFPRRGAAMTLRCYKLIPTEGRNLVAEFRFANPAQSNYPVWEPTRSPSVITHGDLQIELKDLVVGTIGGQPLRVAYLIEGPEAQATLKLTERGLPSRSWKVDRVEATDATGNVVYLQGRTYTWKGQTYLALDQYPWPSEVAWKLRLGLVRNELAMYSTNEVIVVSGLALPPPNDVTPLHLVTNRLGHTVQVLGLSHGTGSFPGKLNTRTNLATRIDVEVTPFTEGKKLTIINLHDDQGRPLKITGWGTLGDSRNNWKKFSFDCQPPSDARALDFTLVFQEIVDAELVLKPLNLMRTNAPSEPGEPDRP